jgi:hypothetical protein
MAALAHIALPAASAVAMAPLPQALDAGGAVAGHQGGVCKNWCGLPKAQDVRPMQCGVLWFVHISKNGGSTTWDYLKRNAAVNHWKTAEIGAPAFALGGPKQWKWNESDGWRDAQLEMRQKEPKLIVHWNARAEGSGYMMRNHLPQVACEMQAKGCDFQMATMLRDPVDHVTSEMGNQKMTPSVLQSHVSTFSNSQVKSLLFNDAENWPSAYKNGDANADIQLIAPASSMIKDFAIVGQTEAMGPALKALQQTLGFSESSVQQLSAPSAEAPVMLLEEDIALIRDSTEVDHLLYNTLCSTTQCSSNGHGAPPDICRGSKYVHQGGGLRNSLVETASAEESMHDLHSVILEANVTDANWGPALGATPTVELKAAGIEAIAQAGVARSALEGAVAAKADLLHATSTEARIELDKKVRIMSAIAEEAEQLAYAAEARAEKVKAMLAADPNAGADPVANAEGEAIAQAAVAAASFKAAKTAREGTLQLPEEERQVAKIKADGLAAHAETEEKLAYEAEKKAARLAQAAADKLGGVMAQVEMESTLDKEAEPEAPQDDLVPESTAAALAASLAEEALNTARDLRVLKNAHATHEDITNAEAVAAEALAQAEAAEQRAYHASSKTGAQLQDTKLAQHGANASDASLKQIEQAPTPAEEMAMGVKSFEGLAVQRAKQVAEKRAQKRLVDEQLNNANEALQAAHAQEINLSQIARQAKKQADLAAADKAAKLRAAEMAAADEEMATKDVSHSVAALKQALDNSSEEDAKALKFAVQRAKRTKQRLMTRTQKFDAKLKKAQVQKALVKADADKVMTLKDAAVKATLDQQATIIETAVEKARQLERAKVALEKSEAVQGAVQAVEDEAKHRVEAMQVETRKLLERANFEKETAFKESEERIRAAAALARDAAKKITDRNTRNAKTLISSTKSEDSKNKPGAAKREAIKSMEKDSSDSAGNDTQINVEQSTISIEGWAAARAAASAKEDVETLGSAKTTISSVAANTSLSAVNMDIDTDEESAVKAAVSLAEQALAAAKEVRFLRESKSASDAQRKQAESKATALAEQAEAAEAKLQLMEQKAETSAKAVAVDALYHPASVEATGRLASTRNSSSSNTSTSAKVLVNATLLSADAPASVADILPPQASLTEEQQKGLAAAAEASLDAVQKAERAQSATSLADPLRKLQRETKDAVLKARDELQTHESSAFHASVKAKEAELEAEMLGKAVAQARESANARREMATSSVVRAAEAAAAAQEAGREASSAQEESKRALASSTKVAVAKAALDRSKVALSSPVASNSSSAAKADLEARQAQAKAQSMAMEAAKARQAVSADESVEAPSSRHS